MNYQHGHGKKGEQSITWKSWLGMKVRCDYPYTSGYKYYGGRGISYDPRWKKFANFLEDMGERPSRGYDLSRLDHDKNYSRDNCLWELVGINRRHGEKPEGYTAITPDAFMDSD